MFAVTNVDDIRNSLACDGLFLWTHDTVMEESESDNVVGSFWWSGESAFRSKERVRGSRRWTEAQIVVAEVDD